MDELSRQTTSGSGRSFLSLSLARRGGREQDESPKGPLGLTTLLDPGPDPPAVADIIFVHGLNGGSQSTWCKSGNPSNFWPREWLRFDDAFRDVRVHTFGYPSAVTRESILNVHDFARSLLAAVKDCPAMSGQDKVRLVPFTCAYEFRANHSYCSHP
jgi:hypothetical protein